MARLAGAVRGGKPRRRRQARRRDGLCVDWRKLRFEAMEERALLSAVLQPCHVIYDPSTHLPCAASSGPRLLAAAMPSGISPLSSASPIGLTPQQICGAYGIDQISMGSITGTGAGQTIAIIDAYDDPALLDSTDPNFASSDLAMFDAEFGLPDPPSFQKLNEFGGTALPGVDPSDDWELEEALDVEWSHAIAPQANIVLIEAASASDADLISTAVDTARNLPGVSAITMSFGRGESSDDVSEGSVFTTPLGHGGVTFLASTGDDGAPGLFPAYSPNVVAVGGTTLTVSGNSYVSETGWSDGGGGQSSYEAEPACQNGVQQSGWRQIPDVSFDADPDSGVAVYDSYDGGSSPWFQVGGTSVSSPCWAGLVAIGNQLRASIGLAAMDGPSQTLPILYAMPAGNFHDITSGYNGGFFAGPGYDEVTGIGSPVANALVPGFITASSRGVVFLSGQSLYIGTTVTQSVEIGTAATITVLDSDLTGDAFCSVTAISSAGDSENVTLAAQGDGAFLGTLPISAGPVTPGDGVLETVPGGSITAIYHDANDGTGHAAVATAQAITYDPLQITTPAALPAAVVGQAYEATLAAGGGLGAYTWSTADTLPPGLVLSPSGVIVGTPTGGAGAYDLSVTVADAALPPHTATESFQMVVAVLPGLAVSVPANATAGDGTVTGTVSIPAPLGNDLSVSLTSADATRAAVPGSVTIPTGQTSATFPITIIDDGLLDGPEAVAIAAAAAGYTGAGGTITVHDDETAVLTVSLPTAAAEMAGIVTGTITSSAAPARDITLQLASSDTSQLTVPATVTLPAGQTTVSFTATLLDNQVIEPGPTPVTVTAGTENWTAGSATVYILDDDRTMTVTLPASGWEGQTLAGAGTVQLGGTLASDLVVSLASSDPSELSVPASVTIPAGQLTASFDVTLLDNGLRTGPLDVQVAATAAGLPTASAGMTVDDSDVDYFTFAAINSQQTAGVPFPATVQACDLLGNLVTTFNGTATLSAAGQNGTIGLTPQSVTFVSGVWTGNVTLNTADSGVALQIAGAGAAGTSNSFTVFNPLTITTPNPLPAASVTMPYSVALAASGGAGNDTWSLARSNNYVESSIAPTWLGGGTAQDWKSEYASWQLTLPWSFPFYGTNYTSVWVCSTGFLDFTSSTNPYEADSDALLEKGDARIAPFSANLATYGWDNDIYITTTADYVAVRWAAWQFFLNQENFEVLLYRNGNIQFDYDGCSTGSWLPTIGVSAGDGVHYTLSSLDGTDNIPAVTSLLYTYSVVPAGLSLSSSGVLSGTPTGATGDYDFNISACDSGTPQHSTFEVFYLDVMPLPVLSITVPTDAAEGDGTVTGTVSIPAPLGSALTVDLSSAAATRAAVPENVTIFAGQTSAAFPITIIDDTLLNGPEAVAISAAATGYTGASGTITVHDNETATLTVSLPASADETAGVLTAAGTVTASAAPARDISVQLVSSDTTGLTVPATVTLPAGQTSVSFDVTMHDDHVIDGPRPITVTARVENWTSGSATLIDLDDDATLGLTLPASGWEGQTLASAGTLQLGGTLASDLVVTLTSSDTSELTVPASVTIPAGQMAATFTVTLLDNGLRTGPLNVQVTATAAGLPAATAGMTVDDSDVDHFTFAALSGQRTVGVPFSVTVQACDMLGNLITTFNGTAALSAVGQGGPISLTPATVTFTSGVWTGNVTVNTVDAGVTLGLSDAAGASGASNAFQVLNPVQITTSSPLPAASVTMPYSTTLTAVGGMGPYTWSATDLTYLQSQPSSGWIYNGNPQGWHGENETWALALPWAFPFYGKQYTSVYVCSSGYLDFTTPDVPAVSSLAALEAAVRIAPLWETDLLTWWGYDIYVTSNAKDVVVRWQAYTWDFTGWINFEAVLYPNGDVAFNYGPASTLPLPATIGISAGDGAHYTISSLNGATSIPADVSTLMTYSGPPTGLTLNSAGVLSGTPSAVGGSQFLVTAADSAAPQNSQTQWFNLNVLALPVLTLGVPANATEGVGTVTGSVGISAAPPSDLTVDLASADAARATVPQSVTIPAGQISATFPITIIDNMLLDGPEAVAITATAVGCTGASGTITVHDNETAVLTVSLPKSAYELDGTIDGTITASAAPARDITLQLASNDTAQLTVPATVTLPAGQTTVGFTATLLDDHVIESAPTPVTVTAGTENWTAGAATVYILDDDHTLTLTLPASGWEGQTLYLDGTVQLGGTLTSDLVVSLTSGDTSELSVPASVTVFAGTRTANFTVTLLDNGLRTGPQSVGVTAAADGFLTATAAMLVKDSDVDHFTFDAIGDQAVDEPFSVTVRAYDFLGNPISVYQGTALLSGSGQTGNVVSPTYVAFTAGVWTGTVTVGALDPAVTLRLGNGAGLTATSNTFAVQPGPVAGFQWSTVASRQIQGAGLSATLTAKDAFGYTATGFNGTVALTGLIGAGVYAPLVISEVYEGTGVDTNPSWVEFTNTTTQDLDVSGWQVYLYDRNTWPGPLPVWTFPDGTIIPAGGVCQLFEDDELDAPGQYPLFYGEFTLGWDNQLTGDPVGVLLEDAAGNIVDFMCGADANPRAITDPTIIPPQRWQGAPVPGNTDNTMSFSRAGDEDHFMASDWTIQPQSGGTLNPGMTLPFLGGTTPVSVAPATVTLVNGVWTGNITVLQSDVNMFLDADDGNWHTSDSNRFDTVLQSGAPAAPVLSPVSDSGWSSNDGITKLNNSGAASTLQFSVGGTLAGAAVTIYADGEALGTAVASGPTTIVTTTPLAGLALADGTYAVTAREALPGQAESPDSPAATVVVDTVGPQVLASSLDEGAIVPPGTLIYTATFSEDMAPSELTGGFSLTGARGETLAAAVATWLDARTVRLEFDDVPTDYYTLTLSSAAGEFQDLAGNALAGDFVVHFTCDAAPTAATGGPYLVGLGTELHLNAGLSTAAGAFPSNQIVAYAWDFDDGQYELTTASATATVPYAQLAALGAGVHTIGLQVTDSFGLIATASTTLEICGGTVALAGNESARIALDPLVSSQADVFLAGAGTTPSYEVDLSYITQWVVTGGAGDNTLTVDFSNGSPLPAGGMSFDGGTNSTADTLQIVGTSGDDTVMLTAARLQFVSSDFIASISYSNVQQFGLDLGSGADSLIISGATLRTPSDEAISAGTAVTIQSGGTLDLGGHTDTVDYVVLRNGTIEDGTLLASSFTLQSGTVSADLAGPAGLQKSSAGTVTLSGKNTCTEGTSIGGGTSVSDGLLVAENSAAIPGGSLLSIGPDGSVVLGDPGASEPLAVAPAGAGGLQQPDGAGTVAAAAPAPQAASTVAAIQTAAAAPAPMLAAAVAAAPAPPAPPATAAAPTATLVAAATSVEPGLASLAPVSTAIPSSAAGPLPADRPSALSRLSSDWLFAADPLNTPSASASWPVSADPYADVAAGQPSGQPGAAALQVATSRTAASGQATDEALLRLTRLLSRHATPFRPISPPRSTGAAARPRSLAGDGPGEGRGTE